MKNLRDAPFVASESAVAGLAGLLLAMNDPVLKSALGLGPESRVLLFGSEGATDADVYEKIVEMPAKDIGKT